VQKKQKEILEKLRGGIPILRTFQARTAELPAPREGGEIPDRFELFGRSFASGLLQPKGQEGKFATFGKLRQGTRAQLTRILGDVGNLSIKEQEAAVNLLPEGTDLPHIRAEKLSSFYAFIIETVAFRNELDPSAVADSFDVIWNPKTRSVTSPVIRAIAEGKAFDFSNQDEQLEIMRIQRERGELFNATTQ